MQQSGNTLLVTGGGTGIGRALAEAFHAAGNTVVIAGRRQEVLDAVTARNPGMHSALLDIADADAVRRVAARLLIDHPALDGVVHNAGVMQFERVQDGALDAAEATVATNLLGPIRLTAALLPHLLARPRATILTVTSGLAFVPRADAPTYCATKAALHSYTQSLRYQLKDTAVQVIEIAPPRVQTALTGPNQAADPNAMPLAEFIAEVMHLLAATPDAGEICVERVKPQRRAEASGDFDALFRTFNDTLAARRAAAAGPRAPAPAGS